ncbi:toll-like receptor 22 [Chanos chanos]|uniref:Toll-like receptor 22 n=1 Tax=Chanos chanos TaxID=29144 RepID=A0A6J2VFQ9_CHACN|nr:toll-like receptor 13 [Chanos chanos]
MKKSVGSHTKYINLTFLVILQAGFFFAPAVSFSFENCTVSGIFNDSNSIKMLCYSMGFQKVPSQIPPDVNILVIAFNHISQFTSDDFGKLPNLIHLNASNNKISRIQDGSFRDLKNLRILDLSDNRLPEISGGMLHGLIQLSTLRLDGNHIKNIEHSAFMNLVNLNVVNLTNNKLQNIEKVQPVLHSPNLKELYIGSNNFSVFHSLNLTVISVSMQKLDLSSNPFLMFNVTDNIFPNLEYLDLSYCGQNGTIEWKITNRTFFSFLKTLNLSGVFITEEATRAVIQSFHGLYKLNLNNMAWKFLDLRNVCSSELRVLRLRNNKISTLKDNIFKPCSSLSELDLAGNKIFSLEPSIQMLPTLELLDLSRNNIKTLTCLDFANLTELRHLYLYSNKIGTVNACLFKDLKKLEVLKLGTNKLLTIAETFSHGPSSLKYLEVQYNKLSTIRKGTFKGLHSLQELDLNNNQIAEIEGHAFTGLVNLTKLLLSSNFLQVKTLNTPDVFSDMHNLQKLHLFSNKISFKSHDTLKRPPFMHLNSLAVLSINSQRHGLKKFPPKLLQGLSSLEMFYAGNLNIRNLPSDAFNSTPNLWFLDLSKNDLADTLSPEVFHPIPRLSKLIISKVQLQSLDFLFNARLSRLSVLRASKNVLDVINPTLIQSLPQLKYLDLQNNTFTCDCSNAWFLNWSMQNNDTQVIYLRQYTCSYPPAVRGMSLADLNIESCSLDLDFIFFTCSSAVVILTLVSSFVYNFLRWHVIYAFHLFLAFLYDSKRKQKQHEFQYDAFISYNVDDESWVLEELLPKLEGEQGWKLCLHHRDFQPGKPIIDNIVDGIYSSRKTICLITHSYLKSEWCSREIQLASFRLFDEQRDVLILVFLEDIPTCQLSPYYRMRKLVKKRTYISWPKPGEDTRVFWQKLRMALEAKESPNAENPVLSGTNVKCN